MRMKNLMIVGAAATSLGGCSRMDGSMPMMHGCGGVFWLLWILVIAAVVYLIVIFSKRIGRQGSESSLDTLKQRYARGELTKEEFEGMKKDIEGR